MTKSLVHLNNHQLVAIDTETTGLDFMRHEIIQIAVIPLNNLLEPETSMPLFDMKIKPLRRDTIDPKAMSVNQTTMQDILDTGLDPSAVRDLFELWFTKLRLGETKKLVPLAKNWPFDKPFLEVFFGHASFHDYFHGHYRDVEAGASFRNDYSDFHAEQTPFPKMGLQDMARRLDIPFIENRCHDAVYDAYLTSKVYKKMIMELVLA